MHPLDDESKFHGVIASPPIPIDQQSLVALNTLSAPLREGGEDRQRESARGGAGVEGLVHGHEAPAAALGIFGQVEDVANGPAYAVEPCEAEHIRLARNPGRIRRKT